MFLSLFSNYRPTISRHDTNAKLFQAQKFIFMDSFPLQNQTEEEAN